MSTKYSSNSSSGFNATPPSDAGAVAEENKVKWSTILNKIGTPLKNYADIINSELATHFDNGPTAITSTTTLGATHYNQIIQVSGAAVTLTLTDAATLTAGWFCEIVNTDSSNTVTLGRATGADTINGTAADYSIAPGQTLKVFVIAAANGFLTMSDVSRRSANNFSVTQTITSTDAGATVGPNMEVYRDSASPAAADVIGAYDFYGEDSAGNKQLYARINGVINDPTSTSEDGKIQIYTTIAGTSTLESEIAGGHILGSPTGSFKGAGTLNAASGVYDNGARLAKVLISSTAITTASFQITSGIDSTYDEYELHIVNLTQTNDNNNLILTVFEAGPTEKTGANDYSYSLNSAYAATSITTNGLVNNTGIQLIYNAANHQLGNGAGFAANFVIKFFVPSNTARHKFFKFEGSYEAGTSGTLVDVTGSGCYKGTTNAIIGVKGTNGGGNQTGAAYLYGIRKS